MRAATRRIQAQADVAATAGANGYGTFELVSGSWSYTLNNAAVQSLDEVVAATSEQPTSAALCTIS